MLKVTVAVSLLASRPVSQPPPSADAALWGCEPVLVNVTFVPAAIVIGVMGEGHVTALLILSQVVLSFQLPFAVVPLIQFTGDRKKMGEFVNGRLTAIFGWALAAAIVVLNAALLWLTFGGKI